MKELPWFERELHFNKAVEMLPYYLERLAGTLVRLKAKVHDVPDDILATQLNGKWSIKQNIGHLAEVDDVANRRLDEMTGGVPVLSPAVFEPKLDYNAMTVAEVLKIFHSSREKNLTKYTSLTEDDLKKQSLHPRLKVMMTPVDLAWFDAEHDDHHLVKINEILVNLIKRK